MQFVGLRRGHICVVLFTFIVSSVKLCRFSCLCMMDYLLILGILFFGFATLAFFLYNFSKRWFRVGVLQVDDDFGMFLFVWVCVGTL